MSAATVGLKCLYPLLAEDLDPIDDSDTYALVRIEPEIADSVQPIMVLPERQPPVKL